VATLVGEVTTMRWVCDHCGNEGRTSDGRTVDEVLCDVCGEPVVPLD
jgi:hypothetical protein